MSEEQSPRFGADPILVADRLGLLTVVLIGAFFAAVLAAILPVQLFNPAWLYGLSGALIDNAPVALLGFALLHLAVYLDPDNPILQRRRLNLGRLALAAVLLFLLLIPMQGYLLWRGLGGANQFQLQQQQIVRNELQQLRNSINKASSTEQLLGSLPEPVSRSLGNESPTLPLAKLKQRLLADVGVASKQLNQRVDQPTRAEILNLWKRSLRVILTSMFYTLAFAAFALRGDNEFTLLQELQLGWRPWHINGESQ